LKKTFHDANLNLHKSSVISDEIGVCLVVELVMFSHESRIPFNILLRTSADPKSNDYNPWFRNFTHSAFSLTQWCRAQSWCEGRTATKKTRYAAVKSSDSLVFSEKCREENNISLDMLEQYEGTPFPV